MSWFWWLKRGIIKKLIYFLLIKHQKGMPTAPSVPKLCFKRQFWSFLTFWGQKLLKTCRKHASGLGQSLKWVDFDDPREKFRKKVKILSAAEGVWKCWFFYISLYKPEKYLELWRKIYGVMWNHVKLVIFLQFDSFHYWSNWKLAFSSSFWTNVTFVMQALTNKILCFSHMSSKSSSWKNQNLLMWYFWQRLWRKKCIRKTYQWSSWKH